MIRQPSHTLLCFVWHDQTVPESHSMNSKRSDERHALLRYNECIAHSMRWRWSGSIVGTKGYFTGPNLMVSVRDGILIVEHTMS